MNSGPIPKSFWKGETPVEPQCLTTTSGQSRLSRSFALPKKFPLAKIGDD